MFPAICEQRRKARNCAVSDIDPLLVTRDGRVAVVTLNRPARMNAMTGLMRERIVKAMAELDDDETVGAIVITGAGERAFCAGLELTELSIGMDFTFNPYAAIEQTRKPTIAAVNGVCVTGGLEVMLACDMAVASTTARFADTHVRLGLLATSAGLARLARHIGLARAKEMQMTGNYMNAQHAFAIGLVNHVVEPDQVLTKALSIAHDMADSPHYRLVLDFKDVLDATYAATLAEAYTLLPELGRKAAHTNEQGLVDAKGVIKERGREQLTA